jgi:hypothetical protein
MGWTLGTDGGGVAGRQATFAANSFRRKGWLATMRIWPTKRFWKRLAIGAAILVALALIANGLMAWRVDHRLQTLIAAIRVAGDPASIADLAPEPIPDDQNAAFYLDQLKLQLAAYDKDNVRFFDSPRGKAYEEADDRGDPPTAEQLAAIRAIVNKYPEIDRGLAAAAACKQYASLADFSLRGNAFLDALLKLRTNPIRSAARYSDWKIKVLTADGKQEQAAELGLQQLHIARLHDAEPLLVNFLVGIAVRAIAAQGLYDAMSAGQMSPQLHAAIDEELAKHDDPQRLVQAFRTDRAYSADLTTSIGLDSSFDKMNPVCMKLVGWQIERFYVDALDSYDRLFDLATKSWPEICRQLGPPGSNPTPTGEGALADLLLPGLKAAYESNARSIAVLRSLRIFNALRQYAEQNGHEARGLEDLPLPKEATIDPFSGEPLKLKHTDDGWIVYSVMDNGVDDGGDFIGLKDYGVAPPRYRATEKHDQPADDSTSSTNQ